MSQAPQEPPPGPRVSRPADGRRRTQPLGDRRNRGRSRRARNRPLRRASPGRRGRLAGHDRRRGNTTPRRLHEEATTEEPPRRRRRRRPDHDRAGPPSPQRVVVVVRNAQPVGGEARPDRAGRAGRASSSAPTSRTKCTSTATTSSRGRTRAARAHQLPRDDVGEFEVGARGAGSADRRARRRLDPRDRHPLAHGLGGSGPARPRVALLLGRLHRPGGLLRRPLGALAAPLLAEEAAAAGAAARGDRVQHGRCGSSSAPPRSHCSSSSSWRPRSATRRPTTSHARFVFVYFWLGVPALSALFGNVWSVLSPWRRPPTPPPGSRSAPGSAGDAVRVPGAVEALAGHRPPARLRGLRARVLGQQQPARDRGRDRPLQPRDLARDARLRPRRMDGERGGLRRLLRPARPHRALRRTGRAPGGPLAVHRPCEPRRTAGDARVHRGHARLGRLRRLQPDRLLGGRGAREADAGGDRALADACRRGRPRRVHGLLLMVGSSRSPTSSP